MDKYNSFYELKQNEMVDRDFTIEVSEGSSGIAIVSPHGGNIEFGTTEIARAVAGDEHTYYSFIGLKEANPRDLHITSHNFDEPKALALVRDSLATVTIHGFRDRQEIVCLGGLDKRLKYFIAKSLKQNGFNVKKNGKYKGVHPKNICNRNLQKQGVQLEISSGLRYKFFADLWTPEGRQILTPLFHDFVQAVRQGIAVYKNFHQFSTGIDSGNSENICKD